MKHLRQPIRLFRPFRVSSRSSLQQVRHVNSTELKSAVAHPVNVHGPPPKAPVPSSEYRRQIDKLRKPLENSAQETLSPNNNTKPSPLKRRFWRDVHIRQADGEPVRTPDKNILKVPLSKPQLAKAIALEWDLLESAQQAAKHHRIPLTSLTGRAEDIALQDSRKETTIRKEISQVMLRYLETDTLLSWAPESDPHLFHGSVATEEDSTAPETLRTRQIRTAQPVIDFLTKDQWAGLEINPTFATDSIFPVAQPEKTRDAIARWITTLKPYDLAGLERATLATKSLLVAARLVIEWSENFIAGPQQTPRRDFGIKRAAEACTLEVRWQTERWGEVEDTHDVQKEDLERQLGSVVLLVSGRGEASQQR
ncbi:ATP synthase complex assembly protein atp12 [Myotisia sp. PD_48]|nr:ATP synthase complex assembly protein atp12 [Myotisia sp. PD_48]